MSHDLEVFADGTGSMFSARETPWHQLGVVTTGALTAEAAMIAARLDWEVTLHPIQASVMDENGVETVEVDDRFATVRTNPESGKREVLGVVGSDYTIVQNLENAEFLNALVHESGAHFETAGSMRGGRRTFISMKLPEAIMVGGTDATDLYLVASNSHDGSRSFTMFITPTRVVCKNTLDFAFRGCHQKIALRHSSGVKGRIQEARETLGLTMRYASVFQHEMESLLSVPMSVREFGEFTDKLWVPTKDKKGAPTARTDGRNLQLVQLFTGAETNDFGRGTRLAALNAVTEYTDWFAPETAARTRAQRIADGALTDTKNHALRLLSV